MYHKKIEKYSCYKNSIPLNCWILRSEETHFVDINQIDARNATEIKMFALCCYADDTGKGTGGKFGTWQTLNYYRTNAADNGSFQLTNMVNSCLSLRQNWLSMIEQMRQIYIKAGLYKQSMDGNSLLKCLSSQNIDYISKSQLQKHSEKKGKYEL